MNEREIKRVEDVKGKLLVFKTKFARFLYNKGIRDEKGAQDLFTSLEDSTDRLQEILDISKKNK